MKVYGNAGVYVGAQAGRPLPQRPDGLHRAHRPWCVDCKKKQERSDLDGTGRCARCARAVVLRAEGEARRAQEGAPVAPRAKKPSKRHTASGVGRGSNSRTLTRLNELGVSALEVKEWAVQHGLADEVRRGRVPAELVDAYAAAVTR